jgi:hypothetical protein
LWWRRDAVVACLNRHVRASFGCGGKPCTGAPVSTLLIHVSELTACHSDTAAMAPPTRRALIGLCLSIAGVPLAGHAGTAHDNRPADDADDGTEHGHDHDHARRAVERGEALPLSDILSRVRPELGGEVVGVTFRRNAGRWIYEFRVIAAAGQLDEIYVDAATARVIKRESH